MWKVGEFGKLIRVSASTLRRWETEGKLSPRFSEQNVQHFKAQKPKINAILQGQQTQLKGKKL